jgi:hypothetical protein
LIFLALLLVTEDEEPVVLVVDGDEVDVVDVVDVVVVAASALRLVYFLRGFSSLGVAAASAASVRAAAFRFLDLL